MLIKAAAGKVIEIITGITSWSTMGMGATDQNIIASVKCPKFFLEPLYDFFFNYARASPYIGRDNDNANCPFKICHNERS
jgi:hypothetical protein